MTAGHRARALLIEDDASIRRFVELALEDEPLDLVQTGTVAEALDRLRRHGPFQLVLTDLMLPDGNGQQVLQILATEAALRGTARVAVFSAGVNAETRAELAVLGVDEILTKPASLHALLDCVHRALQAPLPGSGSAAASGSPTSAAPGPHDGQPTPAAEHHAIASFFSGDRTLYTLYRDSCRRQFPLDRRAGDAALAVADLQALRRLAHSLKTVLKTLGHDLDSVVAGRLEHAAAEGRLDQAQADWARLGQALDRLSSG